MILFLKIQRMLSQPGADVDKQATGATGRLSDMSFTDMIQILCAGGKNAVIRLSRENEEGEVYLHNGDVIHAQLGDVTAEHAFYKFMSWQDGEFTTQLCEDFPEQTIFESAMGLLMEGARLVDEGI